MKPFLSWCRHLWMAIGLRGRLVAGYTALFAVLLVSIAVGESTVVRQVLVDDRKAQLSAVPNGVVQVQGGTGTQITIATGGGQGTASGQSSVAVLGNNEMILASFAMDGSLQSWAAGSDVRTLDPRQLLDRRYLGGNGVRSTTYERTVAGAGYLVQLQSAVSLTPLGLAKQAPPLPPDVTGNSPPGGLSAAGAIGATNMITLTAVSLRSVDDTVRTLLLVSVAASALGLLVAAGLGLAVARRALRPLARMEATAQAIAAGGNGALDRRLCLPAHGDEVSRLATMFDQMLDRIQGTIAERERSETRLRHFAADASHELRTPLATLSGYTEVLLLGGKDDPETAAHVLRQMHRELGRMNRLVADLLTLARLEAGLPAHPQVLPVAPILEGLVEEAHLLATRSRRDLAIDAESESGAVDALTVLADPDRLHQILLNLLHNAVKFTPDGGRVTVRAAHAGGTLAFSVADTGPGIAAAELPFLFERFYRSDMARARGGAEAGGAGLGLAIAQGLARSQGGHIAVESMPGTGSTFTLVLPAATMPPP